MINIPLFLFFAYNNSNKQGEDEMNLRNARSTHLRSVYVGDYFEGEGEGVSDGALKS